MNLRVKIKRLKDVELPKYAREFDAGFDLVAAEDTIIYPEETTVVPTGLALEIPPGYELQVRPRSGISLNTDLSVILGTVDSSYRGEVGVITRNSRSLIGTMTDYVRTIDDEFNQVDGLHPEGTYIIRKGDRIAQGVIAPVVTAHFVEVDELSVSERGLGGFGSTGVK
ncbi:deoxyuridine 5'-triphosphate nucleotidohydrolase (plasmid) [Bacillus mycoides]|uniref:dUTP diphosphatase n=1 Tax=Bacillus mycoides TaxID=1405 RepID=A0A1W6AJU5_BACMY|nr:deoxyuridine 5'-triphosphate nucleotidohydrolase [Bacillus mycoides]ARJ26092.1 deoxyuridine 5'-triphosphate nucleotidohydrolase [Bacillus mycoides]